MNAVDLKKFVDENPKLVMKKQTSFDGVYCLKYRKKVFYGNLWTPELEYCRGTLVDDDFNLVSLPFQKIYNYGIEDKAPSLSNHETVYVSRKVNGFMVAVTMHKDQNRIELIISTTGSTDSDFVQYARDMIGVNIFRYINTCALYPELTFLFECCHPNDPHIVPEEQGMYLLGYREKVYDSNLIVNPNDYYDCTFEDFQEAFDAIPYDAFKLMRLDDMLEEVKTVKHEGFAFYTADFKIGAKIKSPYYLINKFFARCNNTNKLMSGNAKQRFDEEYFPIIDKVQADIDSFVQMTEQERLEWIRVQLG